MAMVVQQNKKDPGIGGHIATYASMATLMEVGFNHFFRATIKDQAAPTSRAISFISRATPRRASIRAPSWKGVCRLSRSKISATNCARSPDCLRIRTPG